MLERIIDFSLKNKFIVLATTLALILGGAYAVKHIPLDAIPDLSDVQVIIFTEYPGQAPRIVEDQVFQVRNYFSMKIRGRRGHLEILSPSELLIDEADPIQDRYDNETRKKNELVQKIKQKEHEMEENRKRVEKLSDYIK